MLTYSVVMTTYNGGKYIKEQLDSLLRQTRRANEVLIFDDCSTDKTVEIVSKFISENGCDKWHIFCNGKNVGWRKNFMNGFSHSSSDVIFCCDQDDIWNDEKCDKMLSAMENNENIGVLACNIAPFFESDVKKHKLAKFNVENYGKHKVEKVKLDKMWLTVMRQGCAMCFKRDLLPAIKNVWFETCAHDRAIWSFGVTIGRLYIYNEPLINFRRHCGTNTPSNNKNSGERSEMLLSQAKLAGRIIDEAESFGTDGKEIAFMKKTERFYRARGEAIAAKKVWKTMSLIRNLNLYVSFKAWVADVYSAMR